MKAKTNIDLFVNINNVPEDMLPFVEFRPVPRAGKGIVIDHVYPAGTIVSGAQAAFMCKIGQASPADDECAQASGMSEAEQAAKRVDYEMDTKGISKKEDRELYRAGVILGYDDSLEYIHGPKWEAYQAAKEEAAKIEEEDI